MTTWERLKQKVGRQVKRHCHSATCCGKVRFHTYVMREEYVREKWLVKSVYANFIFLKCNYCPKETKII